VFQLPGLWLCIFGFIIHWSRLELVPSVLDDSSEECPGKKQMLIENYLRKKQKPEWLCKAGVPHHRKDPTGCPSRLDTPCAT